MKNLTMKSDEKEALMAALRYVSHKDRTVYEVSSKLDSIDCSKEVKEFVLSYLKEHGYLNDRRYAEYYLVCYKDKRSLRRITMELSNKGIDDDVIDEAIELAGVDELQAVRRAMKKQFVRRGISDVNDMSPDEKNKISNALFRQGFRAEHIREVMNEYNGSL